MGEEHRIFGPPGTGKTTYLSRQIESAAGKYGPDRVMVASFTRAAAHELASRGLPVSREHIGTLHSLCYHAIGCPPLVQTKDYLKQWNEEHPLCEISGAEIDLDDPGADLELKRANSLFYEYSRVRAMRRPMEIWRPDVIRFHNLWKGFKEEVGAIDFTDMIERAIEQYPAPPGDVAVAFFDEVQDFSRLELDLVRQWARHVDRVLVAGDDDQSIYGFKGATPMAFLSPELPQSQIRVLHQSFRVPRKIHELAERWIKRVARRQPKEYQPRDADGRIAHNAATFVYPEPLLNVLDEAIAARKSVMVLASCGYMLSATIAVLKAKGYPFHNPYRRKHGGWNPLHSSTDKTSAADRVKAFLREGYNGRWGGRMWTGKELAAWAGCLNSAGIMYRGSKAAIEEFFAGIPGELEPAEVNKLFLEEARNPIYGCDLDWFERNLLPSKSAVRYPIQIVRKFGKDELRNEPLITVGTIHSVKGGEADIVILFPDLSPAADECWHRSGEDRDNIRRTFYVGMTRAKETLILCDSGTTRAVKI